MYNTSCALRFHHHTFSSIQYVNPSFKPYVQQFCVKKYQIYKHPNFHLHNIIIKIYDPQLSGLVKNKQSGYHLPTEETELTVTLILDNTEQVGGQSAIILSWLGQKNLQGMSSRVGLRYGNQVASSGRLGLDKLCRW